MKKNWKLIIILIIGLLFLTGCGIQTGNYLTPEVATGWWQNLIVLPLIYAITWLAQMSGNLGLAVIIATIISRLVALPFTLGQTKSMAAKAALYPEVEKIKQKYIEKKDRESQMKMQQEINQMYKENGINMLAGCLPSLIQMPIMMAFFQSLSRHPLIVGTEISYFLGLNLASVGLLPNYIFAIIVAGLVFYVGKKNQAQNQDPSAPSMTMMNLPMAIMMGSFVVFSPLAMGLYFLISQVLSTLQTLFFGRSKSVAT